MTWGEAGRLLVLLARDPSSALAASLAGWEYPLSREGMVLADLFDVQHASKARQKPKPYPRPWLNAVTKIGGTSRMTVGQLRAVLADPANISHEEGETR